jgi:hypothetical protein
MFPFSWLTSSPSATESPVEDEYSGCNLGLLLSPLSTFEVAIFVKNFNTPPFHSYKQAAANPLIAEIQHTNHNQPTTTQSGFNTTTANQLFCVCVRVCVCVCGASHRPNFAFEFWRRNGNFIPHRDYHTMKTSQNISKTFSFQQTLAEIR